MGLVVTQLGYLAQPRFAQGGQVDGCCERHQGLIGADVGGRALPSDVLLPGRQGEHISRIAFGVHRLPGNPARHLSQVLFAAGDGSSGERLFTRLGFTVFPYQSPLGRFGEFWENFYTWALMWAYNAVSLRQRQLLALDRTESWITSGEFLRRYDTAKVPAQGTSDRQPLEARASTKEPVRNTHHADASRGY